MKSSDIHKPNLVPKLICIYLLPSLLSMIAIMPNSSASPTEGTTMWMVGDALSTSPVSSTGNSEQTTTASSGSTGVSSPGSESTSTAGTAESSTTSTGSLTSTTGPETSSSPASTSTSTGESTTSSSPGEQTTTSSFSSTSSSLLSSSSSPGTPDPSLSTSSSSSLPTSSPSPSSILGDNIVGSRSAEITTTVDPSISPSGSSSQRFVREYFNFFSSSPGRESEVDVMPAYGGVEPTEEEQVNLMIPELGGLQGLVRMATNGFRYSSFRGVPYARPPVGELRFQPPEPIQPWQGERKAWNWGSICMQVGDYPGMSEDCLFLNIHTPFVNKTLTPFAPETLLPVHFIIHGGGYVVGDGNFPPDSMVQYGDLVVISINYRLGAFGFLSTSDAFAPGNYGLMDQIAALSWVNRYAHYFGGDAKRVTISGGSAGASSVHQLILSPLARGLFHQAISHSGTALCPYAIRRSPDKAAISMAEILSCPTTIDRAKVNASQELVQCLKGKNATDLQKAAEHMPEDGSAFKFVPTIDGYVIPREPELMLADGEFANVTWITGLVQDEGMLYAGIGLTDSDFFNNLEQSWSSSECRYALQLQDDILEDKAAKVCDSVKKYYFQDRKFDYQSYYSLIQMVGDRWFNVPAYKSIAYHARKAKVYFYHFKFQGKFAAVNFLNQMAQKQGLPPLPAAVCHGDDFRYSVFAGNMTGTEGKISTAYSGMMRHFSATGEPKPALPEYTMKWRPYDPASGDLAIQTIDDYIRLEQLEVSKLLSFWESLAV